MQNLINHLVLVLVTLYLVFNLVLTQNLNQSSKNKDYFVSQFYCYL